MHTVHNTPFFIQSKKYIKDTEIDFFLLIIYLTILERPHSYHLTLAKYNYYVHSSNHRSMYEVIPEYF